MAFEITKKNCMLVAIVRWRTLSVSHTQDTFSLWIKLILCIAKEVLLQKYFKYIKNQRVNLILEFIIG